MRNTQPTFRLYDHVTVEVTRDRDNRDSETQLANNILSWDASLNYGHPDIKAKRVGDDLIDEFRTHVTAVNPDGSIQIANNPHTAFDGVTGAHPRFTNVRLKPATVITTPLGNSSSQLPMADWNGKSNDSMNTATLISHTNLR